MQAKEMVDDILRLLPLTGKQVRLTRDEVRAMVSAELQEISGKRDWDCFLIHLDPVVMTQTGKREYDLPKNFPNNFAWCAGDDGDYWNCKLDDGTTETLLTWEAPTRFYSRSLRDETNSTPATYTVVSKQSGYRQIVLSPPPDANGSVGYYTIDGLYKPTDWQLNELDAIPPIPGNATVLKYGVLRRYDRALYEPLYREALGDAALEAARGRGSRMKVIVDYPYRSFGGRR